MEAVKKVAVINDLSGIGRCSLTAAIPIISVLGVQCCPYPTAILSNQTNYDTYFFQDLTSSMEEYKNKLTLVSNGFDGIYTGFLGSVEQIDIVLDFIKENKGSLIVVDPVMGDNGRKYDTYTEEMCSKMRKLVEVSDIITPNITESCILLNKGLHNLDFTSEEIKEMLKELSNLGPKKIVITGIVEGNIIHNYIYDKELNEYDIISSNYNGKYYSGTGDIVSSIICALSIKGIDFKVSVQKAIEFITKAINYTNEFDINTNEGVMFEAILGDLIYEQRN